MEFLIGPVEAIDGLFAFIVSTRSTLRLLVVDGSLLTDCLRFQTFLILFNTFVPISLYVTLETVKVFQAKLIANDPTMYYEERDMWAQARTSNLHEDLGQISYAQPLPAPTPCQ